MLKALLKRNIKLFFKDKGLFFTALITPMILLVLYATFLGNVYRDSFSQGLTGVISDKVIDSLVGGQLISSILAVSCVTVAFCSNFLMVNDKVSGAAKDFNISPVKSSTLALSYYLATFISTLIICLLALVLCLGYVAIVGWYMSVTDILLLVLDVILLTLFGTALSSVINVFLSTQGQISAVGTIVSSGYGFICGAYMPISSFAVGLRNVIALLPGTYGTVLVRNHAMRGALKEMSNQGIPDSALDELRDVIDCNLYFFENAVSPTVMYLVLVGSIALLILIYVLLNKLVKSK